MIKLVSKINYEFSENIQFALFSSCNKTNCHDKAAIVHCSSSENERNTCRRKCSKIHTKLMVLGITYIRDNY
jgi:hypothetical protein